MLSLWPRVRHWSGGEAPDTGHGLPDGGPVAEHRKALVRVGLDDAGEGPDEPFAHLLKTLAAGPAPGGVAVVEEGHTLRVGVAGLAEGNVLQVAHFDLPQVRVRPERELFGHVDRTGRGHSPVQVAGVHRVNGNVRKAPGQGLDLTKAVVGNQRVIPAVDAAVQVALGLGVAD